MTDLFREALQTSIPKRPTLQPDAVVNVLATTLSLVILAPFHQSDFPNPVRAKQVPQDFYWSGVTTQGIPAGLGVIEPRLALVSQIFKRAFLQVDQSINLLTSTLTTQGSGTFQLLAAPGSFNVNGGSSNSGFQVDAVAGAFVFTGQAAAFTIATNNYVLTAANGAFTFNGQSVSLTGPAGLNIGGLSTGGGLWKGVGP
jgi:hypothetical protein